MRKTRSFLCRCSFSAIIQEIFCILASSRTLAVMLSPPVSSLSVARNHRPLPSATRPSEMPASKLSDRCHVTKDNLSVAACLRVARACISFKIPFCLANPLGSYLWKLSGLKNLISKCVVLAVHLDHTGGKPLVLCSEAGLNTFVSTAYIPTFLHLTRQSAKPPPRLTAFIAGLLMDP